MADDDAFEMGVVDEEDRAAQRVRGESRGVPMTMSAGGQTVSRSQLVHQPSLSEVRSFSKTQVRTCGMCKHFRHKDFQDVKDTFMAKLIHEYQWNPKFIGDNPANMGRCAQNDQIVVGPSSLGCEVFKAK